MNAQPLAIVPESARGMIEDQFPALRGQSVEPIGAHGTLNTTFRVGDTHVARFPKERGDVAEAVARLKAEAATMQAFAMACPFAAPQPIGIGMPGPQFPMPWTVQTWVSGTVPTHDSHARSDAFADDLVSLIKALRGVSTEGQPFDGRGRGGDLKDHDAWMEECFVRSETLLDVPVLRAMWAQFRELPATGELAMSHRDLIPANLVVAEERLGGVLDTGDFGPADPALDLVAGWHLFDAPRRARFKDALSATDLEWRRGTAWAFQQAMGLVWFYRTSNPVMHDLGVSTLTRLMEATDNRAGG